MSQCTGCKCALLGLKPKNFRGIFKNKSLLQNNYTNKSLLQNICKKIDRFLCIALISNGCIAYYQPKTGTMNRENERNAKPITQVDNSSAFQFSCVVILLSKSGDVLCSSSQMEACNVQFFEVSQQLDAEYPRCVSYRSTFGNGSKNTMLQFMMTGGP